MNFLKLITIPYTRFSNEVSSQDMFKAIALLTMIIDHIGLYFYPNELWMRAIGRVAAPIWLFFVGYNYKSGSSYLSQIFFLAILLQSIAILYGNVYIFPLDVLFTVIIALVVLDYYERCYKAESIRIFLLAILVLIFYPYTKYITQYGILGVYMSIWGYNYKHNIGNKLQESMLAFMLIFITQSSTFGFKILEEIIFVLLLCPLIYALYIYKPITLNINGTSKYIINFVARYSLYVYFFHLVFIIIYKYITNAN